jgi:hypothetical protein
MELTSGKQCVSHVRPSQNSLGRSSTAHYGQPHHNHSSTRNLKVLPKSSAQSIPKVQQQGSLELSRHLPLDNRVDSSQHVAKSDIRCAYVSASYQWDELHDILVMLWPGMGLSRLMEVMEEDYGFRAR